MRKALFTACLCASLQLAAQSGFEVEGSWLYLKPTASDGDLEYGSLITLTLEPANLNALLLEVEPSYHSSYELGAGYFFPCSNQSVQARYFSYRGSDRDRTDIVSENQLIQNFLGASYSTAQARSHHGVDQATLSYHCDTLCLDLSIGLTYANIRRDFDVNFRDLVLSPDPSDLTGSLRSRYWGVGPTFGVGTAFPLLCHLEFAASLNAAVLFGENRAHTTAESFQENMLTSFFAQDSSHPVVTNLNCDLGLSYSRPLACGWDLEVKAGYQLRYFFQPIKRIDPFNGFVVNPDPFPVAQASNLGLQGPYISLSLTQSRCPCYLPTHCSPGCGLFFEFTSYWLEPHSTDKDLVFATLRSAGGEEQELQADPGYNWASRYTLGYRFCPTLDLRLAGFFLQNLTTAPFTAGAGEEISSINASGPADVLFSEAISRVHYKIDQVDGLLGKSIQPCPCLHLHGALGLRYLRQERSLTNQYLGGLPPITTESKFPQLISEYQGVGPLFTLEPTFGPIRHLDLVGRLGLAFLIGGSKATLDQDNLGDVGFSSNTLRTPKTLTLAPVFDGSAGLRWSYDCLCSQFALEGGYQYLAYYKTVRLLLPTLLTGLEQINSDLSFHGPYLRATLTLNF